MNAYETEALVNRCLRSGSGLWVDTDAGELDLFGEDLRSTWELLGPGEGFTVLGVITEDVRKETLMLFSSREPFNDDPNPYVWAEHSPRNKGRTDTEMYRVGVTAEMAEYLDYEYLPRPEYERPQHNPTNHILTEFRSLHEKTGNDLWADAYLFSSDLIEVWDTYVIKDHWYHAMDVLNRIVRLSKLT